eukprot:GHVR01181330.1.p1 GENE.GHVR01181330.1~~GHVR01181330.1.p1  ORF type:complete len:276 (+),score=25.78 GHVR01181330.1:408-1235(+)
MATHTHEESEFVVERLGKGKCKEIIANFDGLYNSNLRLWKNLESKDCMLFKKYKSDADHFFAKHELSAMDLYKWVNGLLYALKFLQNNKIIHNDVKPGNIFMTDNNLPRLGDFGLAVDVTNKEDTSLSGTIAFYSPERAKNLLEFLKSKKEGYEHIWKSHTSKADVFAAGLTIYFVCFLGQSILPRIFKYPYFRLYPMRNVRNMAKFDWDKFVLKQKKKKICPMMNGNGETIDEWSLFGDMLKNDPNERLSAISLLDKYFKITVKIQAPHQVKMR